MHLTMHLTIIKYCWYVYKKTFFFLHTPHAFFKNSPCRRPRPSFRSWPGSGKTRCRRISGESLRPHWNDGCWIIYPDFNGILNIYICVNI